MQDTSLDNEAQYSLKWNNHQNNMVNVFNRLLGDEQFTDVLIAAEGQKIRAHKVTWQGFGRGGGGFFKKKFRCTEVDITLNPFWQLFQVVLSACSSYFESLFMTFDEKNQIVILKDAKFIDVFALVQFIYKGEVNVGQVRI